MNSYDIKDGFNRIAKSYDRANDAMTFGLHRIWRYRLCQKVKQLTPAQGNLLDLATGTGDVLVAVHKLCPQLNLWGSDISQEMLDQAKKKLSHFPSITLQQADARTLLPFPDHFFHTITISWGIRNMIPWEDCLKQCFRVLKSGGTLLILESGMPSHGFWSSFYKIYSKIVPHIGSFVSKYKPAYEYYIESVEKFPTPTEFIEILHKQGFQNGTSTLLNGGIVYLYTCFKA